MIDKIVFMLAERVSAEEYWPDEFDETLENIYNSLEYGDVFEDQYQIWEYPSGKIYKIEPDRKVADKYYYTPPHVDLWEPTLIQIGIDKQRVEEAYESLTKRLKKQSFFNQLKKKLGIR